MSKHRCSCGNPLVSAEAICELCDTKTLVATYGGGQGVGTGSPPLQDSDEQIISYVSRFGGRCRDCADENGVCPSDGTPCDTDQRRAVIAKTIRALRYGIQHGYIPNIFSATNPTTKGARA